MLRRLLTVFCLVSSLECFAQKEVLSNIPKTGKSINDFIPAGYDTLATATGDLNKDGRDDIVLVVADKRAIGAQFSDSLANSLPRYLIVVFRSKNGWTLGGRSAKIILCRECGGISGEPFHKITIDKGILVITHVGGSTGKWTEVRKFRYQKNDFYLISNFNQHTFKTGSGDKVENAESITEENMVTGERHTKVTTWSGKVIMNKKDKITINALIKLIDYDYEN